MFAEEYPGILSEEVDQDTRERERREARKRVLEEEMASEMDRQWEEMVKQRRLKAEVVIVICFIFVVCTFCG